MINTQNKPTPHPHAELIKAWADGAKIQYRINDQTDWEDCNPTPEWFEFHHYRIKPEESRAEPWKPQDGVDYLFVNSFGCVDRKEWDSTSTDDKRYKIGNCFHLQSDAEAAAERVKAALKGDTVSKEEHEHYAEQCRASVKQSHDLECNLYDKIDRLERENKDLKIRNENLEAKAALKGEAINKEDVIAQAVKDGVVVPRKVEVRQHKEIAALEHTLKKARTELDGKPLTDGEAALIKALREATICKVFPKDKTVLCFVDTDMNGKNSICDTDLHIAFETTIFDGNDKDEAIIAALKQIQKEQEAQNEVK